MHFFRFKSIVSASKSRSPIFFLTCVGSSIFVAELVVMFFFMTLPKLPEIMEAFLDSFLLSILIAPGLYYFLYQPLRRENRARQNVEEELRQSAEKLQEYSQTLELKVRDRTQELRHKNLQLEAVVEKLHTTQMQMIQSEKMSSLGQLVAGVAHEINNPVNFIHGNLHHLHTYVDNLLELVNLYQNNYPDLVSEIEATIHKIDLEFLQEDLPKILSSMQMGTDRICEIVLSLRNFSRLDEAELKAINIHHGINSTILILEHRLKFTANHSKINIIYDYSDLPLVECYPGPLNQVLMNILSNAIDAIEEKEVQHLAQGLPAIPSQIKISTTRLEGNFVQISIADNGSGISEAIQQKIFDPFFTTKPIGKGTGMGMAISYQIITEKHGGRLECLSTVGVGTEFRIQIPICTKPEKTPPSNPGSSSPGSSSPGSSSTTASSPS